MTSLANQPSGRAIEPPRWRVEIGKLRRNPAVLAAFAALVAAAVVILLRTHGWLQPAELLAYDKLRVAWAGTATANHVVLVGATEHDITEVNRQGDRVWGWPLRDAGLAAVMQRLASFKPRAIGVDIYRDLPEAPGTAELTAVMQQYRQVDWVFKLGDDAAHPGIPAPKKLRTSSRAVLADVLADGDDVVRRGLLFASDGRNQYPTLGMALAQAYLAAEHIDLRGGPGDDLVLGKALIKPLDQSPGPYIEPDSSGYQIMLDYRGGPQPFPEMSLDGVMSRQDVAAMVRDQVVILGVAADSVHDGVATPFNTGFGRAGLTNGMAVHGHLVDQLIREAEGKSPVLRVLPRRYEDLWILVWAVAGAGLGMACRSTLLTVAGGTGGVAIIGTLVYAAFGRALLLPAVPAVLAWLFAGGLANLLLYRASNRARALLRQAFEHYLPRPVIDQLVKSDKPPSLEGELREITVLFSDVASFTTFSEGRDPRELAAITNAYLEGVSQSILDHQGLVNAFMGDGVLAFFGAPLAQPDHADRAVGAALAIDHFAEAFHARQIDRGVNFGRTRIGLHTGQAFVGNIGSSLRLQYTALGDILNTGSRLEELNKEVGSRICASLEVVEKCRQHRFRPVGGFVLRGRKAPTQVFTPVDPLADEPDWIARYETAFRSLERGEPQARKLFASLHAEHPADACVAYHCERLKQGEIGTVVEMQDK
jgi:adenylate cyclase